MASIELGELSDDVEDAVSRDVVVRNVVAAGFGGQSLRISVCYLPLTPCIFSGHRHRKSNFLGSVPCQLTMPSPQQP